MSRVGGAPGALADLVRARRRALGLTRAGLARHAQLATGTLVAIEEGRTTHPAGATLAALATALALPPAALEATLRPHPATAPAGGGPGAARPYGCLGCGRARGAARQALLARHGAYGTFWLCHDCAWSDASVAELVAAYRRVLPR